MSGRKPKAYTQGQIFQKFKNYIQAAKPGLQRFYKTDGSDQRLEDCAARGSAMTQKLIDSGCAEETAGELTLLTLYDLVVLIDNSISMGIEEDGERVETLKNTLGAVSTVYSYTGEKGITAVRFLNTPNSYSDVTPGKINGLMKRIVFEGLTNIGTKLRDKVLVNHVKLDDTMKKPVLVIVITDAEIEGEATGLLRDVILSQAVELKEKYKEHGPQAVAYQFAKIGNDEAGQGLVQALDDDKLLGSYIDSMGAEDRLEDLQTRMWEILPKLLLGAISNFWDRGNAVNHEDPLLDDDALGSGSAGDGLDDDLEDEEVATDFLTGGKINAGDGSKSGGALNDTNSSAKISTSSNKAEVTARSTMESLSTEFSNTVISSATG